MLNVWKSMLLPMCTVQRNSWDTRSVFSINLFWAPEPAAWEVSVQKSTFWFMQANISNLNLTNNIAKPNCPSEVHVHWLKLTPQIPYSKNAKNQAHVSCSWLHGYGFKSGNSETFGIKSCSMALNLLRTVKNIGFNNEEGQVC